MKFKSEPVDYNNEWPKLFADLKSSIQKNINVEIEHIGSTSIPGMFAKPIIDCLIIVNKGELSLLTKPLESLGFTSKGEYGIPGRAYFTREGYHVHCFEEDSPEIKKHLAYRNYLRAHPTEAKKYADLKKEILNRANITKEKYQEDKSDLIKQQTAEAVRWYDRN